MQFKAFWIKASCLTILGIPLLTACGDAGGDDQTVEVSNTSDALSLAERTARCQADPRVQAGAVSLDICVGADFFFRETFNGNGRTCASCHAVKNNFTIDPAFIATLPGSDPLFVAEFNPTLANLERPAQMRARSLILENVDGTEPGGPNVRFVLRSTPHNLSMGTSILTPTPGVGPQERTGWSADGAPGAGRLADFTAGAINQHFTRSLNRVAGTDFRLSTEDEGQRVALFMRELGRKNEVDLPSIGFSDAGADTGRQRFLAVGCNGCHRNAGANTGAAVTNRNFNTGVESTRNSGLNAFPRDGGLGGTQANADGSFGDQTFNSTPLIEAADTGPFFHTDTTISGAVAHNSASANTIEQATAFYSTPAFANSPAGGGAPLAINAADVNNIGRFLRAINAVFNIQMASNRVQGARTVGNRFPTTPTSAVNVQREMYRNAIEEINDAIAVLQGAQGGTLNGAQVSRLIQARNQLTTAVNAPTGASGTRQTAAGIAFNLLDLADTEIAANINFNIGNGTRMH